MKSVRYIFSVFLFLSMINFSCAKRLQANKLIAADTARRSFIKGADISWLPQMEASGYVFYDTDGKAKDCFQILKECGINTIRLRTWVNPSDDPASGHCSTPETVAMASRAKRWGMHVLIDFHYSDSWADPSKQVKPEA